MQILAISGSLRAGSTNSKLLRAAASLAPEHVNFTFYDGLADLPHFSPELDDDNPPASVTHLRELLQVADGVIICTPEYAFGVPGSLKNALDWTVSTCAFSAKPVAAISASSTYMGGEKATRIPSAHAERIRGKYPRVRKADYRCRSHKNEY